MISEMREVCECCRTWRHLPGITRNEVTVAGKLIVTSCLLFAIAYVLHMNRRLSSPADDVTQFPALYSVARRPTDPSTVAPRVRVHTAAIGNLSYVSMCPSNVDGRRIGNQLFNFAAMLHVAKLTGRQVAMPRRTSFWYLDQIFHIPIARFDDVERDLCPCHEVREERGLTYENSMMTLKSPMSMDLLSNKSLLVCGLTQSWRYTVGIEDELKRHLRPHAYLVDAAGSFFDETVPDGWPKDRISARFLRVGIHVRAGDVLTTHLFIAGFTVPRRQYYRRAMQYVIENATDGSIGASGLTGQHLRRFQFIVVSDNIEWCRGTLQLSSIVESFRSPTVEVDLVYSANRSAAVDFVILTRCDFIVMTTGSFGWWAAWLANKTTVYYSDWPRPGSWLSTIFSREDYFPHHWIPIGGPPLHPRRV